MGLDQEALSFLDRCHSNDEYAVEREHSRGDALHNLGKLKEAQAAYKKGLRLTGHDPQMESKLGYVEVRLGEQGGFQRMHNAIAALPQGAELHERLIKGLHGSGDAAGSGECGRTICFDFDTSQDHPACRSHTRASETG